MSLPLRISLASFLYRTAVKPFHFICIYIVPRFFSLLFQINPLYFYFVVLSFDCFLLLLCLLIDCVWSLIFIVTWYWLNAILGNHAAFNFSPERRKWIYMKKSPWLSYNSTHAHAYNTGFYAYWSFFLGQCLYWISINYALWSHVNTLAMIFFVMRKLFCQTKANSKKPLSILFSSCRFMKIHSVGARFRLYRLFSLDYGQISPISQNLNLKKMMKITFFYSIQTICF